MNDAKCGPARAKYWDELEEKGQIERLRQEVKRLQRTVTSLSKESVKMGVHLHVEDKLVVPIFWAWNGEVSNRNPEYF